MDDKQFIVLSGYDAADLGWYLGFGAVGGGFAAVGIAFVVIWCFEWAAKKYKQRKNTLEGN